MGGISIDCILHDGAQAGHNVAGKKTERKDDWLVQMCPFQLTGAEILALDLTGCITLT